MEHQNRTKRLESSSRAAMRALNKPFKTKTKHQGFLSDFHLNKLKLDVLSFQNALCARGQTHALETDNFVFFLHRV